MYTRAEVLLATTWKCNLRCSYCFVQGNEIADSGDVLAADKARQVVNSLHKGLSHFESICIHFYGGEPLTNLPAMAAILDHSQKRYPGRFTFSITTNGTVLSRRAFELLKAGEFSVTLSIDGPEYIHDACRLTANGGPTHARVLEFLSTLREQTDCSIQGSSVVRSGWNLLDAVDYLESLNVDGFKAQAVRASPGAPQNLSAAEMEEYMNHLEVIGRRVVEDLEERRRPRDARFTKSLLQLLLRTPRKLFCGSGKSVFGVTPSGDVLPCILLNARIHRLGHIEDQEHKWVQSGLQWRQARSGWREECEDCEALFFCGGGCPALMSVCAEGQCLFTRKEAEIAGSIFRQFESNPDALIDLTGITWK